MARIEIDFASRQLWPRFVFILLAIGVVGGLYALWLRDDLLNQRDAKQDEIGRLERLLSHHQRAENAGVRQNPKAEAETKRLAMELQRPWEAMLNSLQKAAKPDMLIVRVQPESDAKRLLISGQADDNQAFLSYIARLRADAAWVVVEPVSEERAAAPFMQAGKPVSFQLRAEWGAE